VQFKSVNFGAGATFLVTSAIQLGLSSINTVCRHGHHSECPTRPDDGHDTFQCTLIVFEC
jgi:hypothetical protein